MNLSASIPQIRTARLLLRGYEPRDVEPYIEMMADPDVTRYLADGRPLSPFDAWRQLAMMAGHWMLNGFGVWAVEELSTGRFLGRVGCNQPYSWPGFEIAYTLSRSAWGKGYGLEAAGASLDYARRVLNRDEILSIIRPANQGSIRIATTLGAVRAESIDFFGSPADLYRYPPVATG